MISAASHLGNIHDEIAQLEKFHKQSKLEYEAEKSRACVIEMKDPDAYYPQQIVRLKNNLQVGGKKCIHMAAPFCGRIVYEITEIDENGNYYGIEIEDTSRELTIADVI